MMLKRFFLHCSGVDMEVITTCSNGEQNKYAGIGATVFFTALMATIASAYALFTVFDLLIPAIFFGVVWGLLIFNLDRFIVSTIKKRDSKLDEFIQAIPRIVLAIIIAIVISKPLELKIFEKEINQVLLEEKNDLTLANQDQIALQYQPKVTALNEEKESLKNAIIAKENETNALYETYIAEAEGREGTQKVGKGPVYAEKRAKHDANLLELQSLKTESKEKIAAIDAQLLDLKNQYDTAVTTSQPIIDNFDGLMARVNALGKLPWLPSFFIFLLFLAIETSPILAKILAAKGEYDLKYEDSENEVSIWVKQKQNQRSQILGTDIELNKKVYNDIADEDELYEYKRKIARNLMQEQADAFYKRQRQNLF